MRFNSRTPGGVRLNVYMRLRASEISFNSRTPGGVRPQQGKDINYEAKVSIHAPREGCDKTEGVRWDNMLKFQFTHPGRGATEKEKILNRLQRVSIHAPREGCDSMVQSCLLWGG